MRGPTQKPTTNNEIVSATSSALRWNWTRSAPAKPDGAAEAKVLREAARVRAE